MEAASPGMFTRIDVVEPPYFTRPAVFKGMKIPDVLLSGDAKKINDWKKDQSKVLTEKWKKLNSSE